MSSFYLVSIDEEKNQTPLPNYGPFKDAPLAAMMAKKAAVDLGIKVLPRRIEQAPNWREKQAARLRNGELKPLPAKWTLPPIDGHFAHRGAKDVWMIGYFPDATHAVMNKAREVKPGAYLVEFYKDLTENERKAFVAVIDEGNEVHFATTEDEIEWVYNNGPSSCMSHGAGHFSSPVHPVRVYAAGDLAIAYMKSKSGKVAERVLTWPDKKIYSRIYGDGSGRLGKKLSEGGYSSADAYDFEGARLKRIVHKSNFVVPYFDHNVDGDSGATRVRDDGNFLILDHEDGPMVAGSTNGLIRAIYGTPALQAA